MTQEQYRSAEEDLIARMQSMREQECGIVPMASSGSSEEDNPLDDPVFRTLSSERERAIEEFRLYCSLCKPMKYQPRSFTGSILELGSISMGKVKERGDDIKGLPPFSTCNLADYMNDDGHFDLVGFLNLNRVTFPTIFKLAVCLASIRTNEVGCEHFFSTA
jgi:hypothetical protein